MAGRVHVIGKDIVRFHAVYWPAFLMSAGVEVPQRIFSHGFLFNRGEKMSKSVGNVIDPFELVDATAGTSALFLLARSAVRAGRQLQQEVIVTRINADLSNDLGNLAQRSLTMIARQFDGVVPQPGALTHRPAILAHADAMIGKAREAMKTRQLHQVLNMVWAVVARPIATSPARRRGRWRRPILSARPRCSTSRPKCCARSRTGAAGNPRAAARCSTSSASRRGARVRPAGRGHRIAPEQASCA